VRVPVKFEVGKTVLTCVCTHSTSDLQEFPSGAGLGASQSRSHIL